MLSSSSWCSCLLHEPILTNSRRGSRYVPSRAASARGVVAPCLCTSLHLLASKLLAAGVDLGVGCLMLELVQTQGDARDATLSLCMSAIWSRVRGAPGTYSANTRRGHARAQTASGSSLKVARRQSGRATVRRSSPRTYRSAGRFVIIARHVSSPACSAVSALLPLLTSST